MASDIHANLGFIFPHNHFYINIITALRLDGEFYVIKNKILISNNLFRFAHVA